MSSHTASANHVALDLKVIDGGFHFTTLSATWAKRAGLDQAGIDAVKTQHVAMRRLQLEAADAVAAGVPVRDGLVAEVEAVEFAMQEAWGIVRNAAWHSHWLDTPGCKCPRRVNHALMGENVRIVSRAIRFKRWNRAVAHKVEFRFLGWNLVMPPPSRG
jgi:hypothetical protein